MRTFSAAFPALKICRHPRFCLKPLNYYGKTIQSVERACDILETIARENEIGVTELSKRLGLHVATVHNLTRTLTTRNYLVNAGGRYRLGPAIPSLNSQWDPALSLSNILQPYAEDIAARTGESAVATILAGSHAEMIVYIPSAQEIGVQFPQKIWSYPLNLATGRILAAFQPKTTWNEFVHRHMTDNNGNEAEKNLSKEDWLREFNKIVAEEMVAVRRTELDAASSFAAPVWGVGYQSVIAALGASCPNFRLTKEHFACMRQAVKEAAGRASLLFQRNNGRETPVNATKYERGKSRP